MSIYSAISGKTFEEIETMYDGQGYGTFKKDVADLVVEELSPIRSRYDELTGTPELDAILDDGAVRARAKARVTYENNRNENRDDFTAVFCVLNGISF